MNARSKKTRPNRRKCASKGIATLQLSSLENEGAARTDEEYHLEKLVELITMPTKKSVRLDLYIDKKDSQMKTQLRMNSCREKVSLFGLVSRASAEYTVVRM
jgi:hypothetical protein